MRLVKGLGCVDCCSIQAINRVLHCRDTDVCPPGMSLSMHQWIIIANDTMSDEERNSSRWKELLVRAADTPACDAHRVILHRWLGKVLKGLTVPYCHEFVSVLSHWDTDALAVCMQQYYHKWCTGARLHVRISDGLSKYMNRGELSPLLRTLIRGNYVTIDPYSVLEEMTNGVTAVS